MPALLAATDVRAHETGAGNTIRLAGSKDATVTVLYQHALPGTPGRSVKGVLVEYIYATVIEGEVRSKVNDGPEKTYRTGENRTELPGDHHVVSANASETKPRQDSRGLCR